MILAPYVKDAGVGGRVLHAETKRRLDDLGLDVTWVEIDPKDRTQYSRVLRDAWLCDGDLTIIEQTIGIHAGVMPGFEECRQPWCGNPYLIGAQLLVCLGCTRFTGALKSALPGLMDEAASIGEEDGGAVPAGAWQRMDIRVAACLERHGHARHWHNPPVEHFHDYPMSQRMPDA